VLLSALQRPEVDSQIAQVHPTPVSSPDAPCRPVPHTVPLVGRSYEHFRQVHDYIKPGIYSCLGDLAMAIGAGMEKYLQYWFTALQATHPNKP